MTNNEQDDIKQLRADVARAVEQLRVQVPLAQSLTNSVTVNFVANAQLAIGATAAMVYLADEAETLIGIAGATYINLGTLLPVHGESLPAAAAATLAVGKPWVLDPVAIGIGSLRATIVGKFRATPPTVVRANASEVIALAKAWELEVTPDDADARITGARGVDSTDDVESARNSAIALARFTGGVVAASGAVDLITDGQMIVRAPGGSELSNRITGAGCALGGVMASYICVASPLVAAVAASAHFNRAAERAESRCGGPGSYYVEFIDALAALSSADIAASELTVESL
jgi:hydroxyethylthiazole kinase